VLNTSLLPGVLAAVEQHPMDMVRVAVALVVIEQAQDYL
jgi:hypothetical protein